MIGFGVQHLTKRYDRTTVLDDLTLEVSSGRALVLRGPNGAGKTTLLRCLLGAERPDSGQVILDGRPHDPASYAYWSQVYGILDDFTWFPELTLGDHFTLLDPAADAEAALDSFGIVHLHDRIPVSLSSGQLRRAALATMLVRAWRVLLLDEPEQRLDDAGLTRLAVALNRFQAERRTVVLSTHSDRLQALVDGDVVTLGR